MKKTRVATLKPGKEKPIKARHHWIFSGAVASLPTDLEDGEILSVEDSKGNFLGKSYWNRHSSIMGRMISFEDKPTSETLLERLQQALTMRQSILNPLQTNAFRLINGEGDALPGLTVDIYGNVAVLQISTLGMERLKETIVMHLKALLPLEAIYEKSTVPSRNEEGLKDAKGLLFGKLPEQIVVKEYGHSFLVDIENGQKTGFFLDQREMRQLVKEHAQGKHVLNTFGYSGGFSVYALAGGAQHVETVDISAQALSLADKNLALNGFSKERCTATCEDVFEFLRKRDVLTDFVILDPPAFAKKKKHVIPACRGYKDINRLVMQKLPPNSLLLTCSCSYFIPEDLFQKVVFQAACEANRFVRILARHRLAADHPLNLHHPEGDYLKSFLLYVE